MCHVNFLKRASCVIPTWQDLQDLVHTPDRWICSDPKMSVRMVLAVVHHWGIPEYFLIISLSSSSWHGTWTKCAP